MAQVQCQQIGQAGRTVLNRGITPQTYNAYYNPSNNEIRTARMTLSGTGIEMMMTLMKFTVGVASSTIGFHENDPWFYDQDGSLMRK